MLPLPNGKIWKLKTKTCFHENIANDLSIEGQGPTKLVGGAQKANHQNDHWCFY
jgi:hypothetical protein